MARPLVGLAAQRKNLPRMRDEGPPRMSDDTILETEDLTKDFAGFVAVNGVSLRVKRGTIHALIGPNGAGKTTCFNLLTKFLSPTRGRILFKGEDITDMQPADRRASWPGAVVPDLGRVSPYDRVGERAHRLAARARRDRLTSGIRRRCSTI